MIDLLLDPYPEADGFLVVIDGRPLLDGKGGFTVILPSEAMNATHGVLSDRLYRIQWAMVDPGTLKDITPP